MVGYIDNNIVPCFVSFFIKKKIIIIKLCFLQFLDWLNDFNTAFHRSSLLSLFYFQFFVTVLYYNLFNKSSLLSLSPFSAIILLSLIVFHIGLVSFILMYTHVYFELCPDNFQHSSSALYFKNFLVFFYPVNKVYYTPYNVFLLAVF